MGEVKVKLPEGGHRGLGAWTSGFGPGRFRRLCGHFGARRGSYGPSFERYSGSLDSGAGLTREFDAEFPVGSFWPHVQTVRIV